MDHKLIIALYALGLFLAPAIDAGVLAPLGLSTSLSFFALLAAVGATRLPRSTWWGMTLAGAFWEDLTLLLPPLSTVTLVIVMGGVLAFITRWLTSRSYWTDFASIFLSLVFGLLAEMATRFLDARLTGSIGALRYTGGAFVVAFFFALLVATVLRSRARQNLYLS